jgi:hypothetical protein
LGNVAIGAYSEGYNRLKVLFRDPQGSILEFDEAWKEIWDLDCAISKYGDFNEFQNNLKSWLKPGRRFRIYHTTSTSGGWRPNRLEEIFGKGILISRKGHAIKNTLSREVEVEAEELHDPNGDWSVVYFSDEYLTQDSSHDSTAHPEFRDCAHDLTPHILVGHCMSRSVFV